MKKSLLICAAGFLALSTAAYEALSIAPAAEQVVPAVVIEPLRQAPPARAIEAPPGSLAIREAHSDGGYWYWQQ
jgi:hypothetical protein